MSGYQPQPEHPPQSPYSDGLEVSYNEAVSIPEWISGGYEDPSDQKFTVDGTEANKKEDNGPPVVELPAFEETPARPWWKRKTILLSTITAVTLIVIAFGVGLGVGLPSKNKGDGESGESDPPEDSTGPPPSCNGGICPQILATTVYQSSLLVFARTVNGTIAYRNYTDSWADWNDLGDAVGDFISQPFVRSWKVSKEFTRVDLVAVTNNRRSAYGTWYSEHEGWAPEEGYWVDRGGRAGSVINTCFSDPKKMYFWMKDYKTEQIRFSKWDPKYSNPEDVSKEGKDGLTEDLGDFSSDGDDWIAVGPSMDYSASSAPAVACHHLDSSFPVEVFWYGKDRTTLLHYRYHNSGEDWHEGFMEEGDWLADPVVYVFDGVKNRIELFCITTARTLEHFIVTGLHDKEESDFDETELGGSLLSAPAVISLGEKDLDIVALGKDGYLQHIHYNGEKWSEWEDLGIRANSAPSIEVVGDQLFLLGVSDDGRLLSWRRDTSSRYIWKDSLKLEDLGGNLTLSYFTG
ncbi:hypothetical protein ACO1O0_008740 [Amphichorda felina]